jgi:hypothetical protein
MLLDTSNRLHYDIMTALRGPDIDGASNCAELAFATKLKQAFTVQIRIWVEHVYHPRVPLAGYTHKREMELLRWAEAAEYVPRWWEHWSSHTKSALLALPQVLAEDKVTDIDRLLNLIHKLRKAFSEKRPPYDPLPLSF